jgi:hypothetical protein
VQVAVALPEIVASVWSPPVQLIAEPESLKTTVPVGVPDPGEVTDTVAV